MICRLVCLGLIVGFGWWLLAGCTPLRVIEIGWSASQMISHMPVPDEPEDVPEDAKKRP